MNCIYRGIKIAINPSGLNKKHLWAEWYMPSQEETHPYCLDGYDCFEMLPRVEKRIDELLAV